MIGKRDKTFVLKILAKQLQDSINQDTDEKLKDVKEEDREVNYLLARLNPSNRTLELKRAVETLLSWSKEEVTKEDRSSILDGYSPKLKAILIVKMDKWLRNHLQTEEQLDGWLTYGLPDGSNIEDAGEYVDSEVFMSDCLLLFATAVLEEF